MEFTMEENPVQITTTRFIKLNDSEVLMIGEDLNDETQWWYDTNRPFKNNIQDEKQKYIAVQTYKGKDPNNFIKHQHLNLLFTDQAEYYAVCDDCYSIHRRNQWSGHTRNSNWRRDSQRFLDKHTKLNGWCQFCDPIFGNGGWSID